MTRPGRPIGIQKIAPEKALLDQLRRPIDSHLVGSACPVCGAQPGADHVTYLHNNYRFIIIEPTGHVVGSGGCKQRSANWRTDAICPVCEPKAAERWQRMMECPVCLSVRHKKIFSPLVSNPPDDCIEHDRILHKAYERMVEVYGRSNNQHNALANGCIARIHGGDSGLRDVCPICNPITFEEWTDRVKHGRAVFREWWDV